MAVTAKQGWRARLLLEPSILYKHPNTHNRVRQLYTLVEQWGRRSDETQHICKSD
jgi:hypothetical protein